MSLEEHGQVISLSWVLFPPKSMEYYKLEIILRPLVVIGSYFRS